jgi:hypothetical protein
MVALHQIAELRLQIDCTMKLVVVELLVDGGPDAVRGRLGRADDVTHVLGDGDVQPAQDALIAQAQFRIMALFSGWRSRDVGGEAELPEERIEEAAPFFVVRFTVWSTVVGGVVAVGASASPSTEDV